LATYHQNKDVAHILYHTQPEVDRLYATHAPNDWLFGYPDETLAHLNQTFPGVAPNMSFEDCKHRGYDIIYSGEDDPSKTRQYYSFQGSSTIDCEPNRVIPKLVKPCWGSTEANALHGTDGAQFAPLGITQEGGSVTTWVDDLSRELPLYNTDSETTSMQGILLHKFKVRPQELQCAANNTNNHQYYSYDLDGYWNITYAQGLLPTFISQPHLLYANPLMFEYFDGMARPTREQHETWLGVELNTGMTLSGRKRWQINFGLKPLKFPLGDEWFPLLNWPEGKAEYLYHPMVWMQLQGDVSEDDASTFKGGVYLAQSMEKAIKWGGFSLGLLAVLGAVVAWYPLLRPKGETSQGLAPVV